MDGTVEATVETVLSGERNGVLVVAVAAAGVLAGAALELLLLLLELPHPASTSATPARARIDDLGTGLFSCRWGIGYETALGAGRLAFPPLTARTSTSRNLRCFIDSTSTGLLPDEPSGPRYIGSADGAAREQRARGPFSDALPAV